MAKVKIKSSSWVPENQIITQKSYLDSVKKIKKKMILKT